MMKPVQDRQRDDLLGELRAPAHWLLLVHALMRTGGVVEADKLGDQLSQVRLVEDEHMIEQFPSERRRIRPKSLMGARIAGTNPTLSAKHTFSDTAFPVYLDERNLRVIPYSGVGGWSMRLAGDPLDCPSCSCVRLRSIGSVLRKPHDEGASGKRSFVKIVSRCSHDNIGMERLRRTVVQLEEAKRCI